MDCRLSLFGPPRLLDDQGKLIPVPAKAYTLVAYLLLASGGAPATRGAVRRFLWENADAKTGAANLRKFLLRVRERQAKYGIELIRCEWDNVALGSSVDVDLAEFLRLTANRDPANLGRLCDLYRGDLLEGHESDESESRDWLQVQRTKLRDAFVGTVTEALETGAAEADGIAVRIAARRLIEVDPYNESAHRTLMRLFAEEREPARIKELYRGLKQRLALDLRVQPDPATTALYQSLIPQAAAPGDVGAPPAANGAARIFAAAAPAADSPALRPAVDPMRSVLQRDLAQPDGGPRPSATYRAGLPRITVLPPPPLSGQDLRHQIATSLIEDVTIGLCRFRALSVIAPHTAWELSQSGKRGLFRTYGIDYAVETMLQNRGGELWLSVKLVDAVERNVLWTDQHALSPAQESQHYHRLSVQILSLLVDRVERAELARYETEQNPTAYHFFLLGQRQLHKLDLPSIRKARRAFRDAVAACADFVPAISGLSRTLQLEWLLRAQDGSEFLSEAKKLASRSVDLDPDDSRGYRELGVCLAYAGEFDEGLSALAHAEQRNPQHADLLNDFADVLVHACDPGRAMDKIEQAIELNPLCPDQYWWAAAGANYQLERYSDAVECMSRMRDQTPALRLLAASWGMIGDQNRAEKYARMTREIHPDFSIGSLLTIIPFRDPKIIGKYKEGLRAAGFK